MPTCIHHSHTISCIPRYTLPAKVYAVLHGLTWLILSGTQGATVRFGSSCSQCAGWLSVCPSVCVRGHTHATCPSYLTEATPGLARPQAISTLAMWCGMDVHEVFLIVSCPWWPHPRNTPYRSARGLARRAKPLSAALDRWWAQPETLQEIAASSQHMIDSALAFRNKPDGGVAAANERSCPPPASDQFKFSPCPSVSLLGSRALSSSALSLSLALSFDSLCC
ncbi:hypothetical protein F5Y07DRAFT_301015 [Xylaria sp. FL0933]|nr:hypothetical protein F5Y07DRAFT_301015 [Xylaria sp. FL0933]